MRVFVLCVFVLCACSVSCACFASFSAALVFYTNHVFHRQNMPALQILDILNVLLPIHWSKAETAADALKIKLKYALSEDAARRNGQVVLVWDQPQFPSQCSANVFEGGKVVTQIMLLLKKHSKHGPTVRYAVLLLFSLMHLNDFNNVNSQAKQCSTAISLADGVEIIVDVIKKHPYDRTIQCACVHLLMGMWRLRNLDNRHPEVLVRLRELIKLAVSRSSKDYLSSTGSAAAYPVRKCAFDLLRELDTLIGDRGDPLAVEPLRIVALSSGKRCAPGGSQEEEFWVSTHKSIAVARSRHKKALSAR